MTDPLIILQAVAGSFLPALLWLWFWRKEDRKHPEPRRLVALAFLAGMLVVAPVLRMEQYVYSTLTNQYDRILVWAAIEEIAKFIAAYLIVLRSREVDEPMDYVLYLITAALGFAAIENFFFILGPLSNGLAITSLITGNMRFLGASLLHVVASGIIGASLAFGFYKRWIWKRLYLLTGVILSIALHALFNSSIIMFGGKSSLTVSAAIWVLVIVFLLILEKIKRLHPTASH